MTKENNCVGVFYYNDYLIACDDAKDNDNMVVVYDSDNWFHACSYDELNDIAFGEYGYQWIVEKDGSQKSFNDFVDDFLFCENSKKDGVK